MPRGAPALPGATRSPAAARPHHARPTRQPSVCPANEGAPRSNSISGERGKVPSRGRLARSPAKEGIPVQRRVSIFSGGISVPGTFFSCPLSWFSICMEVGGVLAGDGTISPPPRIFFSCPRFRLCGRALDSERTCPWFELHSQSFSFLLFVLIDINGGCRIKISDVSQYITFDILQSIEKQASIGYRIKKIELTIKLSIYCINRVFAENLVGLGFLQSVSYIKSISTHEKIFAVGKSDPKMPLLT